MWIAQKISKRTVFEGLRYKFGNKGVLFLQREFFFVCGLEHHSASSGHIQTFHVFDIGHFGCPIVQECVFRLEVCVFFWRDLKDECVVTNHTNEKIACERVNIFSH